MRTGIGKKAATASDRETRAARWAAYIVEHCDIFPPACPPEKIARAAIKCADTEAVEGRTAALRVIWESHFWVLHTAPAELHAAGQRRGHGPPATLDAAG